MKIINGLIKPLIQVICRHYVRLYHTLEEMAQHDQYAGDHLNIIHPYFPLFRFFHSLSPPNHTGQNIKIGVAEYLNPCVLNYSHLVTCYSKNLLKTHRQYHCSDKNRYNGYTVFKPFDFFPPPICECLIFQSHEK